MTTTPEPGAPTRSYRPGDWFGIVGERAVVLLPPTQKHRVAALWELVDAGAGFDVTLDALISGGLRELPGFVLMSTCDGQTQMVLRGSARAELDVAGESVTVEAAGAATWVERTIDGVGRVSIVVDAAGGEDPGAAGSSTYTVDGGLFRMSRLDETPAHEGDDESGVEPAYEREFPLAPTDLPAELPAEVPAEPAAAAGIDIDTEPDGPAGWNDAPDPEPAPERSAEPPAWTPSLPVAPPAAPPIPPMPPVAAPPVAPPPPALRESEPVDHDGLTVTGSWQPPAPVSPGIAGQPPAPDVTRPVARLELPGGEVIDVDRAVVVGRAPEPRRFSPTEQPRLVTVHSPNLEVSSTHLEVRPGVGADHGSAVATDLGSTNGTVLVQAGLPPQDLEAGQTVQLLPGAVLDLGDGVLVRVAQPHR